MNRPYFVFFAAVMVALLLTGCGGQPPSPLEEVNRGLCGVPTFSVILDDMKEEDNFFKAYYHKYRVVTGSDSRGGDWQEWSS